MPGTWVLLQVASISLLVSHYLVDDPRFFFTKWQLTFSESVTMEVPWVSYWPRNCPASLLPPSTGKSKAPASPGWRREGHLTFHREEGQTCACWARRPPSTGHKHRSLTHRSARSSGWPAQMGLHGTMGVRSCRLLPFPSLLLTLLTMFSGTTSEIIEVTGFPLGLLLGKLKPRQQGSRGLKS